MTLARQESIVGLCLAIGSWSSPARCWPGSGGTVAAGARPVPEDVARLQAAGSPPAVRRGGHGVARSQPGGEQPVPPVVARRANPLFLKLWLAVFVLVLVLLALALMDWVATRLYARRQRRALARALGNAPEDAPAVVSDQRESRFARRPDVLTRPFQRELIEKSAPRILAWGFLVIAA